MPARSRTPPTRRPDGGRTDDRVQGSGFRVWTMDGGRWTIGFRVQGLGFRDGVGISRLWANDSLWLRKRVTAPMNSGVQASVYLARRTYVRTPGSLFF